MTINTASLGGGGVFLPTFASGGLSHDLGVSDLTITPPTGERVKINILTGINGLVSNLSLSLNGVNLTSGLTLATGTTSIAGRFSIGLNSPSASSSSAYMHSSIIGGEDEAIVISCPVQTYDTIGYSYEFGVIK